VGEIKTDPMAVLRVPDAVADGSAGVSRRHEATQTPSPETVRPQRLPPVLPKSIEVDVGGRTPLWLAATVIKVSGSGHTLKLIARRSDDQGDLKLPVYGRDITWRVPARP